MSVARRQTLMVLASLTSAALLGAGAAVLLVAGDSGPAPTAAASVSGSVSTPSPPRPSPTRPPATPSASSVPAPPAPAQPTANGTPSRPTGPPSLTRAALRSAPVDVCGRSPARLRDGRLPVDGDQPSVELVDSALGDLDGDGVEEAAVVVACSLGNSVTSEVLVYRRGPTLLGRVPVETGLDSEVQGHAVRLAGGVLDVSGRFQAEDDARCCPSGLVVRQYRLRGDQLERITGPGVDEGARLTSGAGWSTVRVGDSYEQLARATGLPVTVTAYQDGDPHEASCADVVLRDPGSTYLVGGNGRVQAVVVEDPAVLTGAGLGVGSTERAVLAAYGRRVQRVPNAYGSTPDVVLPTGGGQVVRFQFDQHKRVRVVHAGDEDYALLAEGCH